MQKLKSTLVTLLRSHEAKSCAGDTERLEQLAATTDDYILKRGLWTIVIISGPVVFIVMPLLISVLTPFMPEPVNMTLWIIAKILMTAVFVMFGVTMYFTLKSDN